MLAHLFGVPIVEVIKYCLRFWRDFLLLLFAANNYGQKKQSSEKQGYS